MEITETSQITFDRVDLKTLPVGAKLLVQCKNDWRMAVVSSVFAERVVLQICSPSGRTYRKKCPDETILYFDGTFHLLGEGVWREQYVKYDCRW